MSSEKRGVLERGANFFEKLHYGIGAAALAGAMIVPMAAEGLVIFSAYEFGHGAVWNWLKNKSKKKS